MRIANKYFDFTGHRQLGLRYEDLLIQKPAVEEALRRLPLEGKTKQRMKLKIRELDVFWMFYWFFEDFFLGFQTKKYNLQRNRIDINF